MPTDNFDEFRRSLRDFQRKIEEKAQRMEELDGQHVALTEMLTDEFMERHTTFSSAQSFFDAFPPMAALGDDDPDAVRELLASPEWDIHVATNAPFATWEEMLGAASQEWLGEKLR